MPQLFLKQHPTANRVAAGIAFAMIVGAISFAVRNVRAKRHV